MKKVEDYIRSIPNFPEKDIIFRDVTSVLQDADGLKLAIDEMVKLLDGVDCDVIAGTESHHSQHHLTISPSHQLQASVHPHPAIHL